MTVAVRHFPILSYFSQEAAEPGGIRSRGLMAEIILIPARGLSMRRIPTEPIIFLALTTMGFASCLDRQQLAPETAVHPVCRVLPLISEVVRGFWARR